ncbi:MAG: glycoside hydrolase family 30 beta sandwich domain-containing protein [Bacteroidales bacterium]|nr:glycoside hydrolase family 30 beta sandwich domain-containing protein [Bacteroidales bacterium]
MKRIFCLLLTIIISFPTIFCQSSKIKKTQVNVLVTDATRSNDLKRETIKFSQKKNISKIISLNPSHKYQQIDGFGAALTGSSCFNLMKMKKDDREKFLTQTFSQKNGYGFSYIRISIGCSDFSLSEYTCCDKKGIENFSLQSEELNYVIPVLQQIKRINPDIMILGSPWTPPKWMKVNNLEELKEFDSWTNGQLNPKYYDDYALYFVKWIKAFNMFGIKIDAITPQNEPLNRANSASLFMGWKEQSDFVKNALGPAFKKADIKTKIYAFDHNYNYDNLEDQQNYPINMYEDGEVYDYLAGTAYHNYMGNKDELNRIHGIFPEKELIFTETSIGTWNDGQNLDKRLVDDMNEVGIGTINRWCKASIVWNLMLDSERGPKREKGCKTCYGAVDIDNETFSEITKNSHYYLIAHLSDVVKPGAVRIENDNNENDGIVCSSFVNKDKSKAFVVTNKNKSQKEIGINDNGKFISYVLPPNSIVSFRWK